GAADVHAGGSKYGAQLGLRLECAVRVEQRGIGHVARGWNMAWAQTRPRVALAALEAGGGARVDDLRRGVADQRLHLARVPHQLGVETRREVSRRTARRLPVLQRAPLRLPFLEAAVEHRHVVV